LVTGAGGFVGANLVRAINKRGFDVVGLLRPGSNAWRLQGLEHTIARGDVTNGDALAGLIREFKPTVIIHSATHGGYATQQDAHRIAHTNYTSILNLLLAVQEHMPETIVLNLGSSSEYGSKREPMRETDMLEPNSVYGASKAAAGLLARAFAKERGVAVFNLRLFSPYGAWEDPTRLVPSALSHALANLDFPMTSGRQGRDFIWMDDVSRIILESDFSNLAKGAVFNLGSGVQTSVFDAACLAYHVTGSSARVLRGAIPDRSHDSFDSLWQADIAHAQRSLNWGQLAPLEAGFAHTARWLREYDGPEYRITQKV
jgi:nucleoside-diphosphate-sugar epimerase